MKMKTLLGAVALAGVSLSAGNVLAQTTSEVQASANFTVVAGIETVQDMDFSNIEVQGGVPASGDTAVLSAVDGTMICSGKFGCDAATPQVGIVDIAYPVTGSGTIKCYPTSVTLTNGSDSIDVTSLKLAHNFGSQGGAIGGVETSCAVNAGGSGAIFPASTPPGDYTVQVGGTLDGSTATSTFAEGVYSTTGGTAVTVELIFQ